MKKNMIAKDKFEKHFDRQALKYDFPENEKPMQV